MPFCADSMPFAYGPGPPQTMTSRHGRVCSRHFSAGKEHPRVRSHDTPFLISPTCLHSWCRHRGSGHCLAVAARRSHRDRDRQRPQWCGRQCGQRRAAELFLCAAAGRSIHLAAVAQAAAGQRLATEAAASDGSSPMGLGAGFSCRLSRQRVARHHRQTFAPGRTKPPGFRYAARRDRHGCRPFDHRQAGALPDRSRLCCSATPDGAAARAGQ